MPPGITQPQLDLFQHALRAHRSARYPEAIELLKEHLQLSPDDANAHAQLAASLWALHQYELALPHCQEALRLRPSSAPFHSDLGAILHKLGRLEEATASLQHALQLKEDHPEAHKHLGEVLLDRGLPSKAIPHLLRAVERRPNYTSALSSLATCHTKLGQIKELIQTHRRLADLLPNSAHAGSNLAYMLHYDQDCSQRTLFAHHLRFARKFAKPLYKHIQPHTNDLDPDRPLKIGYVSNDLYAHPVSRFVEPVFQHHNKGQFQIFLYSATPNEDSITDRIKSYGHAWRDIRTLSDSQAADQIRSDKIDILIDLMGYIGGHRLLIFAHKPAPLQITYLGYPNTTGLATMDYKITDALYDPPGLNDSCHTEKLLRLDPCAWCYRPDDNAPPVNDLPALKTGHITFAALNRIVKASPQVRELWAQILSALPNSRLRILVDHPNDKSILDLFTQSGLPAHRVDLVGRCKRLAYLRQYHHCDIALDSFPYNGHTTTCDALYMGLPVISLVGQAHISRAGLSVLSNVGHPEFLAHSPRQYVDLALAVAQNLSRLSHLRQSLRARLQNSPLCDEQSFTRRFEQSLRQTWRTHCASNKTQKIIPFCPNIPHPCVV